MLHSYVERVWSFGYVFSWEFIHYWSEYAQKKKKGAFFIVSFSIGHVYGRVGLLHSVYVSERVRMRAYLWDSILVYILGESMSHPFDFCERDEWLFFNISGSLFYPSFHLFRMWLFSMLWCRMTITHFSISSSSFYPYFIPPFHSISSYLILFPFCFMFALGLVHTHHTCSFDVTIHLSSLFMWGPLGPGLMTFSTHCISCMRGMRIISLGLLSLVSIHFFTLLP